MYNSETENDVYVPKKHRPVKQNTLIQYNHSYNCHSHRSGRSTDIMSSPPITPNDQLNFSLPPKISRPVAGPSRPPSRASLRSNLSAQLSGLFSRASMETNERTALLPDGRIPEHSTTGSSTGDEAGGGIRRNYTQEMDDQEDDGKAPAAARRSPQRTSRL